MKQVKISNQVFRIQTTQTPKGIMIEIFERSNEFSPAMLLDSYEFANLMDAIGQFSEAISKDSKNETSDRDNK